MEKKAYTCYEQCDYANDILIAVNSTNNIEVKRISYYIAYNNRMKNVNNQYLPENFFLNIEINNKPYVIGGVRIKELDRDYQARKKQMETLIRWTNEINLSYCWNYLENNISKCEVGDINRFGQQNIEVPVGFPDHAIFKARIPLE